MRQRQCLVAGTDAHTNANIISHTLAHANAHTISHTLAHANTHTISHTLAHADRAASEPMGQLRQSHPFIRQRPEVPPQTAFSVQP